MSLVRLSNDEIYRLLINIRIYKGSIKLLPFSMQRFHVKHIRHKFNNVKSMRLNYSNKFICENRIV